MEKISKTKRARFYRTEILQEITSDPFKGYSKIAERLGTSPQQISALLHEEGYNRVYCYETNRYVTILTGNPCHEKCLKNWVGSKIKIKNRGKNDGI